MAKPARNAPATDSQSRAKLQQPKGQRCASAEKRLGLQRFHWLAVENSFATIIFTVGFAAAMLSWRTG